MPAKLLRMEMMEAISLISEFSAMQEALAGNHQSIQDAFVELLRIAQSLKNREVARLASRLKIHESIEDEIIYPAVLLIGRYLRERC
jgi:hypothetical protein